MNTNLERSKQIQIEWVARHLMALILVVAGTSKLFSDGSFATYYAGQFASEALRIQVPNVLISIYLTVIPFIELGLGVALLLARLKPLTVYAWYAFMASLLVGHYVLQEWSSVNQMLGYFFLGMICHALPTHADQPK